MPALAHAGIHKHVSRHSRLIMTCAGVFVLGPSHAHQERSSVSETVGVCATQNATAAGHKHLTLTPASASVPVQSLVTDHKSSVQHLASVSALVDKPDAEHQRSSTEIRANVSAHPQHSARAIRGSIVILVSVSVPRDPAVPEHSNSTQ